jgi:hypothetical protein
MERKMLDLETIFTEEEKAALSLLVSRGFKVFTEGKLGDVRELDGSRRRTFRNEGRYDLILALKKAEMPVQEPAEVPVKAPAKVPVATGDSPPKQLEDMSYHELQMEAKKDPEAKVGGKSTVVLKEIIADYRRKKALLLQKF